MGNTCNRQEEDFIDYRVLLHKLVSQDHDWGTTLNHITSDPLLCELILDTDRGWNVMFYAVDQRRTDVVSRLLEEGAKFMDVDKDNKTVLFYAIKNRDLETLELFMKKRALTVADFELSETVAPNAFYYYALSDSSLLKLVLSYVSPDFRRDSPCLYAVFLLDLYEMSVELPIFEDIRKNNLTVLLNMAIEVVLGEIERDPVFGNDQLRTLFVKLVKNLHHFAENYPDFNEQGEREKTDLFGDLVCRLGILVRKKNTLFSDSEVMNSFEMIFAIFKKYLEFIPMSALKDYAKCFKRLLTSSGIVKKRCLYDVGIYHKLKDHYLKHDKRQLAAKMYRVLSQFEVEDVVKYENSLYEGFSISLKTHSNIHEKLRADLCKIYFPQTKDPRDEESDDDEEQEKKLRAETGFFLMNERIKSDETGDFCFELGKINYTMTEDNEKATEYFFKAIGKNFNYYSRIITYLELWRNKKTVEKKQVNECISNLLNSILMMENEEKRKYLLDVTFQLDSSGLYAFFIGKWYVNNNMFEKGIENLLEATEKDHKNKEFVELLKFAYLKSGLKPTAVKYLE